MSKLDIIKNYESFLDMSFTIKIGDYIDFYSDMRYIIGGIQLCHKNHTQLFLDYNKIRDLENDYNLFI